MSKMSSLIILLKTFKEYIDSSTIALKNFVIYCRLAPKCKYAHQNLHGGPERVSFEKTVLITLRYIGHAGNIGPISDLFNVSDSTVVTCRNRVISALGSLKDEYICWPLDAQSRANVSTKFQEK